MNHASGDPNDRGIALGHESSDVDVRGLLLFVAGLFATLFVTGALVWWLLTMFAKESTQSEPPLSPFAEDRSPPPAPHLQSVPADELRKYLTQEEEILNSAAWIDRQRNLARIPIEDAIEIVSKEGLPRWPAVRPEQPAESAEEQP